MFQESHKQNENEQTTTQEMLQQQKHRIDLKL